MNVLMGDCATCVGDCTSGWEVQIAEMPSVAFCFNIRPGCACQIALDELTLAAGQMTPTRDAITWDMILNDDVWELQAGDRRLDAKDAERNYEIRDGRLVVLPKRSDDLRMLEDEDSEDSSPPKHGDEMRTLEEEEDFEDFSSERRLQQTNVRCDFEVETASAADALAVRQTLEALTLEQIESTLRDKLGEITTFNYTIGAVYMMSEIETEQRVETVNLVTSGVASADFWTWLPVLAIVAAVFFT